MRRALRLLAPALLGVALLCALAPVARAAWPNDPSVNVPIATGAGAQLSPRLVADGSGGAIVVWADLPSGNWSSSRFYAKHLLASGALDPAWPAGGLSINSDWRYRNGPAAASDGAGGAYVGWYAMINGDYDWDSYVHHVLPSGTLDPTWPVDGLRLTAVNGRQMISTVMPDGRGGLYVALVDDAVAPLYTEFLLHVLATGTLDPAWPAGGLKVSALAASQSYIALVPDGAGGMVVGWIDDRSPGAGVYAQHVLASGSVDPGWPVNGRALSTNSGAKMFLRAASDDAAGAFLVWRDARGADEDIYAHHVLAGGAADPAWPTDGLALCNASGYQAAPDLMGDGSGGALALWYDSRSGVTQDLYAQRVLANGSLSAGWPVNGRSVVTVVGAIGWFAMVPDGLGGMLLDWTDARTGSQHVYAEHVSGAGAVDASWPALGRNVCMATYSQSNLVAVSDGAGGSLLAWQDYRTGQTQTDADVYAQRVDRWSYLGAQPAITSVADLPNDQGGYVVVQWTKSALDVGFSGAVGQYWIWRQVPASGAQALRSRGAHDVASGATPADSPHGLLRALPTAAGTTYWEYLGYQSADGRALYSAVVATACDSVPGSNPLTTFMVEARSIGAAWWCSDAVGGYSVDNLAPGVTSPFTGVYANLTTALHWGVNGSPGLATYRLYRGSAPGFVPSPANLVVTKADTGYVDVAGGPYYYKLTAVDVHGNEGAAAFATPSGTVGVEAPAAAVALALAAPAPNPLRSATTLRFTLPRAADVSLAVYDQQGRRVRTLAEGARPAGGHAIVWDGRDDGGRALASALYFVRLGCEGRTLTRRLAVLR